MIATNKIIFAFDPFACGEKILQNRTGIILWGCIKCCHVTSQYFTGHIAKVVKVIETTKPKHYLQFKSIIQNSPLYVFGKESLTGLPDEEYWGSIWEYITGTKKFFIEIGYELSLPCLNFFVDYSDLPLFKNERQK